MQGSDYSAPHPALSWRDYVSIFLVSAALIVFQIALTRVLSVVAWYHFAFLTISMVMLGLGVPGVWFALLRRPQRLFEGMLALSGVMVPLAVVLLLRWGAEARTHSALLLIAFVLPATLTLGAAVCLLLLRATGASIGRLYAVDLAGACLGALLVIPLLHSVPTPQLVVGCGLLPLIALALQRSAWRWVSIPLTLSLIALWPSPLLRVQRSKAYDETHMRLVYEKWSPTARLAVFDWSDGYTNTDKGGFAWGRGGNAPNRQRVAEYWLEQDGSAGTPITHFTGDLSRLQHLLYDVTALGYQVAPRQRAAIIGGGGGRDILSALLTYVPHVDVVELNPHTIQALSQRFGEFSGYIYQRPQVHAHAAEGRNFLTNSTGNYDSIQISLIDSWAASAAGAFALAENNLYTTEAFALYVSKLSAAGVLSTSRWTHELPRLIVLARATLRELGVEHPQQHLMLGVAGYVGTLLLSKQPFSDADKRQFLQVCQTRGFAAIYPAGPALGVTPHARLIAGDYSAFDEWGLSTVPPSDDRPYFFQAVSPFSDPKKLTPDAVQAAGFAFNLESTLLLRETMKWVSALALALFFSPFITRALRALLRRQAGPQGSVTPLGELCLGSLYFAAIGAGFMLLESLLLQRFVLYLGHPSYATTVILASLLLGMGLGSAASERVGLRRLQRLGWIAPLLGLGLLASTAGLFQNTLGWPLPARILLTCGLLTPIGALLGCFFPLGMVRFGDENKAWFWAINGAFGVVASVMSLALSMHFSFSVVGYVSVAIYVVAWLCLRNSSKTTLGHSAAS